MKLLTWSRGRCQPTPCHRDRCSCNIGTICSSFFSSSFLHVGFLFFVTFDCSSFGRNFILLKLLFHLKSYCCCHLKCLVKPKISLVALAVINQILFSCLLFFLSQAWTDTGRLYAMKLFWGPKGTYTHCCMAVYHTVDVDFGQMPKKKKKCQVCVCDPRCLLIQKPRKKSDIAHA